MTDRGDVANRIDRLQQLAGLDTSGLAACFDDDLKAWVTDCIRIELGMVPPPIDTPQALFKVLEELDTSRRAWAQRLGRLVIDLYDGDTPGEKSAAAQDLREYATQCPWAYLRHSALNKIGEL